MKVFESLTTLFGTATKAAVEGVHTLTSKLTPIAIESLKKFNVNIKPVLENGLKYAKNISIQVVETIKKKEQLAKNVLGISKAFWERAKIRGKEVSDRLEEIVERMKDKQQEKLSDERRKALEKEQETLQKEQACLEHMENDANRIEELALSERLHDMDLMVSKANHAAKVAIIQEEETGMVDPAILEEFIEYESSLMSRVENLENAKKEVEADEFNYMKQLLVILSEEIDELKVELANAQKDSPDEVPEVVRRIEEDKAEILILENTLHLAETEENAEDELLKKAMKIHTIMESLKKIDNEEKIMINNGMKQTA